MMSVHGDGFTTHTAELSSGNVTYHEAGEGEPLVFVHGFAVNSTLWTEVAKRLSPTHRVILPDLPFGSHREAMNPGADLSPPGSAALLSEFLAALGLDGVTLIGNDSGGAICQITVTEHRERISRLVLTNCDSLEVFPPGTFKLLVKALKLPGFSSVLANSMRLRANQRSPLAFGALTKGRLPDETLDSWVRPQIEDRGVRRDARKFGSGMDPKHTIAAAEKLRTLKIPVLLLWGEDDRFFKVELAERLQQLIPNSRLVRIPDAVTFVSLDEPERVAIEIAGFCGETRAQAATASAS